jgi:hypothetical protein
VSGNSGDSGDSGDAGNVTRSAAGVFFADRVDLPFITEPGVDQQLTARRTFGERNWSADKAAWRAVADFGVSGWRDGVGAIEVPAPGQMTQKTVEEEIHDLQTKARDERPDALGEIIAQADEFISYFMTVMGATPRTHPATFRVFNIANLIAIMVVMHFKGVHDRARPSHICPALLPPLEVPGHASYPSGHSTQAHLFARCAKAMLPQEKGDDVVVGVVLDALAARIARNREIAGLHYESDSKAGEYLAGKIFDILSGNTRMQNFKMAMTNAIAEWKAQ